MKDFLAWPIAAVWLFSASCGYAENGLVNKYYNYAGGLYFAFSDTDFRITTGDSESPVEETSSPYQLGEGGPYTRCITKGLQFFVFQFEKYCDLFITRNAKGPLRVPLILSGREKMSGTRRGYLDPVMVSKASSYVKEMTKNGEVAYVPAGNPPAFNFSRKPWMVSNYGKGQWVILLIDRKELGQTSNVPKNTLHRLVVANGFFYPSDPTLFWSNSRVKTLIIVHKDFKISANLKDTPQLQEITLPRELDLNTRQEFRLEIVDVYPGTKYKDVGLSAVLYEVELD